MNENRWMSYNDRLISKCWVFDHSCLDIRLPEILSKVFADDITTVISFGTQILQLEDRVISKEGSHRKCLGLP